MNFITIFKRHYTTQYTDSFLKTMVFDVKKHVGRGFSVALYYPYQENECFAVDKDELELFYDAVLMVFVATKKSFQEFETFFNNSGKIYVEVAKELDLSDLKKSYLAYFKAWLEYGSPLWFSFIMNERISEKVRKIIEEKCKKLGKDSTLYINSIYTPPEKTEIAKLREEIAANKEDWLKEDKLKELTEKYSWLSCMDLQNNPWTIGEMKNFVQELKSTKEIETISLEKVKQDLELNEEQEKLVFIMNRLSFIKDQRDDYRREAVFYSRKLYNKIAEEFGVEFKDLIYMTKDEIVDLIDNQNKIDPSELEKRRKGFLIIQYEDHMQITTDAAAKMEELGLPEKQEYSGEVKGICGSKGKVSGKAVIVEKIEDLHKVKQGDIMIAITTHPDFVPAMSRAAAIVTDEGGLTCHAAIVSREMGTPCIVGTKTATKSFKDGDNVEVDANNGVVKKVET